MSLVNTSVPSISGVDETVESTISEGLISREAARLFQWICFTTCEAIALFGMVTNIINIICFIKIGFKDPVNVSLLGLAISDLGSLVTLLWTCLCYIPAFQEADMPFSPHEVQYLATGWPHIICTRVTSWITALVTLERCLCVTMPLKVKSILTPRRVAYIIASIFTLLTISAFPVYYANRYAWRFSVKRNGTILGLTYTEDRATVEQISFAINNVFVPFAAFTVIIICMIILVSKLKDQAQWRMRSAAQSKVDVASERDQKVTRMVIGISLLFIACFIPSGFIFIAMCVEPELAIGGKYLNMLIVVYGFGFFLESTNSSLNIFIYYHMSVKYRQQFKQIFTRKNVSATACRD